MVNKALQQSQEKYQLEPSIRDFLLDENLFSSYIRFNRMLVDYLEMKQLPFEFKSLLSFFDSAAERNLRPRTLQVYKCQIRRILEELINRNPEKFSTLDRYKLEQTFKHMKSGIVQTRAVPEEKILSIDEINELVSSVPKRLSLIIRFLAVTGVRISELTGILTYNCEVFHKSVRITFIGKRKKQRSIKIRKPLYNEIIRVFQPCGILFCKKDMNKYTPDHLNKQISKYGLKVLGKNITAHMFRHSFATRMKAEGYDLNAIADWLGHSDKSITDEMYNHPAPLTERDLPEY